MAGLQLVLALPVGAMLPYNKREDQGLHSTEQEPCEQRGSSQRRSLAHRKENFQQQFSNQQQGGVHTRSKWDTYLEAQRSHHSRNAGMGPESSGRSLQGWLYSSGTQAGHAKASHQDFVPFTKKRVGVDRAYPLKPVFHRKSHSTLGDHNVSPRLVEPREISYCGSFGPGNRVNSPAFRLDFSASRRNSKVVKPNRPEWTRLQKLEAVGESLEEEIRRKEALLKEKLRKTEEELRRIQKEREWAKANENREPQMLNFSRKGLRGQGSATHRPAFSLVSESGSEEACCRDGVEEETWGCSLEDSSPFHLSESGMQMLKKERLVTKSHKTQHHPPSAGSLREPVSGTWEALNSAWHQGSTSDTGLSAPPHSSGSSRTPADSELGECEHCGRRFLLRRLERHSTICSRVQATKRKVFDSSRARAKGTELEQYLNWKGRTETKTEPPPKSNWRQKHESFIRTLRQARETQQVIAKGGNPSDLPPLLPAENPDYVQCPHCSRHFAPKVAERHIPKCKTIRNRPPPPRKHNS